MNIIVTGVCFLGAFFVTLSRGAGPGFVYAYLPALLLFSKVSGFQVLGLPDPTPPSAAIYGILGASVLRGRPAQLRFEGVDYLFLLLPLAYVVSAVRTEYLYTGISIFGSVILDLIAPYFIARCSLEGRSTQREGLFVLVACTLLLTLFALIEVRLWPNTYQLLLAAAGLRDAPLDYVNTRFGFFRAATSFVHPIDQGVSAALIFVAIATLALRSGVGLRKLWVRTGLAAALLTSFFALSFTSFLGLGAGLALYLLLTALPPVRRFLPVLILAVITAGFLYAAHLADAPLSESAAGESTLGGSFWVRQLIISQAWSIAADAGLFGWGRFVQVGILKSVDNAYLLIAIQRGWIALGLWLSVPVFVALVVSRSLRRARSQRGVHAVVLAFCGSVGTMVAMFTVFLGCVYQSIFIVVVALTVSAAQAAESLARERVRPVAPFAARAARSSA